MSKIYQEKFKALKKHCVKQMQTNRKDSVIYAEHEFILDVIRENESLKKELSQFTGFQSN